MKNIRLFARVSFVQKLMLTKHLAIMIRSGVPISDAFETLASHTENEYFKEILEGILKDIENGKSLYNSMKKYPKVFDKYYISMIKVSEESGTLEDNLDFLSKQLAKDYALHKKVQGAMFYPALIFFAGLGIGGYVALFILPQLVDFFETLDVDLPMSTRILLFFANLMKEHGIIIFIGIISAMVIFKALISQKNIKPLWHKLLLKMPLFGKVIKYGQLARFCRNFGTLLKSGVSVSDALATSADTISNLTYQRLFHKVGEYLNKGKDISDAMYKINAEEFPPIVVKMIRIGEDTGNLEEVLVYLSDFYEDEVDNITENLTTVLEPIMLVIIGLGVAFMAMAIIGPIYKLTGSIK